MIFGTQNDLSAGDADRRSNMKSTGLLLFSHGSLAAESDATLLKHAERIRERGIFAAVEIGFLNYAKPEFDDAVVSLSTAGVKRIVVAPYFLTPGYFVRTALPMTLHSAKDAYPHIEFIAAKCIDYDDRLPETLLSIAQASSTPDIDMEDSGLMVLSHGSRDLKANSSLEQVVAEIEKRAFFGGVRLAFLQINSPSGPEAASDLIRCGAKQVIVLPYFLHPGNHVQEDLPKLLQLLQGDYPNIKFKISEILGKSPVISDILRDRSITALIHKEMVKI
jgi:sirohydrochlorin cobaltochelatase